MFAVSIFLSKNNCRVSSIKTGDTEMKQKKTEIRKNNTTVFKEKLMHMLFKEKKKQSEYI